jgi:hypothetical protein
LHAWDRRRHHRCHRHGTRLVNGHRQRGWISDLFSSQPRPELGGSPVDTCLHPWSAVRPARCTPTHWTVHVQCLYISYLSVNKPVLSYLLSRLLPQACTVVIGRRRDGRISYFVWECILKNGPGPTTRQSPPPPPPSQENHWITGCFTFHTGFYHSLPYRHSVH